MSDIKIPGVGPVDKKKVLIIGGATAVIVGIAYMRRKTVAAQTATDTSTADATDSGTTADSSEYGDGYDAGSQDYGGGGYDVGGNGDVYSSGNYDAAGYPLGSQADLAWEAQQTGTSVGTTTPTTNAMWVEDAEQQLGNTTTVSTALAKVLGGLPVTSAQKSLFLEAVGIVGNPPQGYPPIKMTDTPSQPKPPAKKREITATGNEDISQIAKKYGISYATILAYNTKLKRYFGTGKKIPKGTKVTV